MFKHVEFLKHACQAKQVIQKNSFILNISEVKISNNIILKTGLSASEVQRNPMT